MSAIAKVQNLKDAHLKFILGCLSRTSDFHQIKQKFQEFFETGISGEVLMEVAEKHKDKIIELKEALPFDERTKDVPIADPVIQLQLLDKLHKDCLIARVVNVTREGVDIEKIDHPTALRCIEVANRIRSSEKEFELKKKAAEKDNPPSTPGESTDITPLPGSGIPGGFSVRIINRLDDEDEEESL